MYFVFYKSQLWIFLLELMPKIERKLPNHYIHDQWFFTWYDQTILVLPFAPPLASPHQHLHTSPSTPPPPLGLPVLSSYPPHPLHDSSTPSPPSLWFRFLLVPPQPWALWFLLLPPQLWPRSHFFSDLPFLAQHPKDNLELSRLFLPSFNEWHCLRRLSFGRWWKTEKHSCRCSVTSMRSCPPQYPRSSTPLNPSPSLFRN